MDAKEQRVMEEYAGRVADLKAARLEPLRRNIPLDSRGLTLICVARNEGWRLPAFFDHYRCLGVRRFAFVDNDSTDHSRDFLSAQPDTDLWSAVDKYSSRRRISWIHRLMAEYGYNAWYLTVDADEHVVYHGCEEHNLDSLIALAEHDGNTRLRGAFVDMYGDKPLGGDPESESVDDVREECPYFDASPYAFDTCEINIFAKGGARLRMFRQLGQQRLTPAMTKYPLAYIRRGDFLLSSHHMAPVWANYVSKCVLGILHYKFSQRDLDKMQDALQNTQYHNNSQEYRCYAEWLEKHPGQSLMCECSKKYQSSQDLVEAGIIMALDWRRPANTPTIFKGHPFFLRADKFRREVMRTIKKEKKFWHRLNLPTDF